MEKKDSLKGYQGIFFDESTCKKLLALQKDALKKPVLDMHITFHYGLIERYPDQLLGRDIPLRLIGYASDGKNSGFLVELPESLRRFYRNFDRNHQEKPPHITVSLGEDGKAVDTANLKFEPLEEPIDISGQLGYVIYDVPEKGKKEKCMDNSIIDERNAQKMKKEF